jgi:predicted O-linked N-acetylglucosamine transferase (SPINDLY family)
MSEIDILCEKAFKAFGESRFDESLLLCEKILTKNPLHYRALKIAGLAAGTQKQYARAADFLSKVIGSAEADAVFHYNFGTILHHCKRYDEAITNYKEAIKKNPSYEAALNNLSALYLIFGRLSEAEELSKKAIALKPADPLAYTNYGTILKDSGHISEAIKAYRDALHFDPAYSLAASNLLITLCYDEHTSFEDLATEHRAIAEKSYPSHRMPQSPQPKGSSKTGPMRIGYVSPDFRNHSVAYYIEALLRHHNPEHVDVFCYSHVMQPDAVTQRLVSFVPHWRDISRNSDAEAAALIQKDGIDCLVDLSGHSADNRLGIFCYKPAPVQMTYLGYPMTTGLSTIDYRITNSIADPQGEEQFYSEKLVRLPRPFLCYTPPVDAPPVAVAPCQANGFITFGSYNNLPKVTTKDIALWSRILAAIPQSRLVLKSKPFNDSTVQQTYKKLFTEQGIDSQRILFLGHSGSTALHLAEYGRIDIALDTTRYNGTTTTCEALWMGVPVITLAGSHHPSRVGAVILSAVGIKTMVCNSDEQYVKLAVFLSKNQSHLIKLRQSLRQSMIGSALCDGQGFAACMEETIKNLLQSL